MKEKPLRERTAFGQRLFAARKAAGLSQQEVAKALAISQGTLSDLEREGLSSGYTVQLATLYGVDPYTLAEGPDSRGSRSLAQVMSQGRNYPTPPNLLPWGTLMTADLTRPFELEVIDGAFGEDIPRGSVMRLEPGRAPVGGRPALVKDREGNFYLRDYQAGAGGRWQAVARVQRGFQPLDSVDDGLELVAVMKGFDYP